MLTSKDYPPFTDEQIKPEIRSLVLTYTHYYI